MQEQSGRPANQAGCQLARASPGAFLLGAGGVHVGRSRLAQISIAAVHLFLDALCLAEFQVMSLACVECVESICRNGMRTTNPVSKYRSMHFAALIFVDFVLPHERVDPASDRLRERCLPDSVRCLRKLANPMHVFCRRHAARDFIFSS